MDADVIDLARHQAALGERADEIIGHALQLRSKLKAATNLPLPDADRLIAALSEFLAQAKEYPR